MILSFFFDVFLYITKYLMNAMTYILSKIIEPYMLSKKIVARSTEFLKRGKITQKQLLGDAGVHKPKKGICK